MHLGLKKKRKEEEEEGNWIICRELCDFVEALKTFFPSS